MTTKARQSRSNVLLPSLGIGVERRRYPIFVSMWEQKISPAAARRPTGLAKTRRKRTLHAPVLSQFPANLDFELIQPALLDRLRCPLTKNALRIATDDEIASLNQSIQDRQARDHLDSLVETAIDGGLVSEAAERLFPIRNRIASLVIEESIRLA